MIKRFWKRNIFLELLILSIISPCFALDLDTIDNNSARKTYSTTTVQQAPQQQTTTPVVQPVIQEQVKQAEPLVQDLRHYEKLPNVPKLPDKAFSSSVAPINTMYTGKVPDRNAIIPCTDIKVEDLILDKKYSSTKVVNVVTPKPSKQKPVTVSNYRYKRLAKGVQFRVVNTTKITDYMAQGQKLTFKSTQDIKTPTMTIPKGTVFTGVIEDVHRPQMTCNGGLVAIRFTNLQLNGYNQQIDGKIIKIKTDKIRLGNLKGQHTYWKTVGKKAKWGQTKYKQWSATSSRLADKGAGVIVAPFPYIGGCVLACASTVSSPITALLGRGGNLVIPANTVFTIKLNEDAKIRF